jgi:hypothetical protein
MRESDRLDLSRPLPVACVDAQARFHGFVYRLVFFVVEPVSVRGQSYIPYFRRIAQKAAVPEKCRGFIDLHFVQTVESLVRMIDDHRQIVPPEEAGM